MIKKRSTLQEFTWKGINGKGLPVNGQEFGYSEQTVRNAISNNNIFVTQMSARPLSFWKQRSHKATNKDITLFSRQMATMLEAGVSLSETLRLIRMGEKKAQMRQIIAEVQEKIEDGATLHHALQRSSSLFTPFYCSLIMIGEQTGRLPQLFARLTTYREKSEQLHAQVIKAMIYPMAMLCVALAVSLVMLIYVIPSFKEIFSSFNSELPWFTQKVLNLASFVQKYGLYALIGSVAGFFAARSYIAKNEELKLKLSFYTLQLPLFGEVLTKACLARFTRTLATTFNAGLPLLAGLNAAQKSMNNLYFESVMNEVYQQTSSGKPLSRAIDESGAFPHLVTQMIMIGEESGALDDMLNKVATIYEQDVEDTVSNLNKVTEPLLIVIIGVLIGTLVVAMYLPMFDLVGSV
ncbi:MAG: type II secretion system F family protein [Vibrionaceae bacterium]